MSFAYRALTLSVLLVPGIAAAQDPPPPPPTIYGPAPAESVAVTATPSPGLDEDPHIDRVWFSPTAITQPKGTFSFNDWELIFLGLTVGVTDNFQLTAVLLPPILDDMPIAGALSGKLGFSADERLHFAVAGTLIFASDDGDATSVGLLGGVISLCTDDRCASVVSGFVYTGFSLEEDDDAFPIAFGLSLVQRLGKHVKLLLEVGSGGLIASTDSQLLEGALLSYGVRFFTGNIAGDIGFVRPITFEEEYDDPFILGLPAVTFSYRWGGR